MNVCVTLDGNGQVGGGWGRASRVAIARIANGRIDSWEEFDVGWDRLHDEGGEGAHHARIARFLQEHQVNAVIAGHMGPPMQNTLTKMGIAVRVGVSGDARTAALAAAPTN